MLPAAATRDTYVSLEHRRSHKQHSYICSNSQQYIVWVKIIHFYFMPFRILRSCSMKIFSKFPIINISKLNFWLLICIAEILIWTSLKMIFSIFIFFCTLYINIIYSAFRWCIHLNFIKLTLKTGFVLQGHILCCTLVFSKRNFAYAHKTCDGNNIRWEEICIWMLLLANTEFICVIDAYVRECECSVSLGPHKLCALNALKYNWSFHLIFIPSSVHLWSDCRVSVCYLAAVRSGQTGSDEVWKGGGVSASVFTLSASNIPCFTNNPNPRVGLSARR